MQEAIAHLEGGSTNNNVYTDQRSDETAERNLQTCKKPRSSNPKPHRNQVFIPTAVTSAKPRRLRSAQFFWRRPLWVGVGRSNTGLVLRISSVIGCCRRWVKPRNTAKHLDSCLAVYSEKKWVLLHSAGWLPPNTHFLYTQEKTEETQDLKAATDCKCLNQCL